MKVVRFGIKSIEESLDDFVKTCKAVEKGLPVKRQVGTYFTNLEALLNFLTPKRLELLHLIKENNPKSIYQLARLAKRGFPAVFADVQTLVRHGLVKLPRVKDSPRKALRPSVEYDGIDIHIAI